MSTTRSRKLFVNLPVSNLSRSVEFFKRLGFAFNPQFTDESATCMILSEEAFVMLLEEARFKSFTKKQLCETKTHTECLLALNLDSRAEVDEFVHAAVAAGGSHAMPKIDLGFMYGWSFYDLDGHHWEVGYMDMGAFPKQ